MERKKGGEGRERGKIIYYFSPTSFTYGHHPGNARIVKRRGRMELERKKRGGGGKKKKRRTAVSLILHLSPLYPFWRRPRKGKESEGGRGERGGGGEGGRRKESYQ